MFFKSDFRESSVDSQSIENEEDHSSVTQRTIPDGPGCVGCGVQRIGLI